MSDAARAKPAPPPASAPRARGWADAGWFLALAGVALAISGPALRGTWLWDDNSEFTQNPALRDPLGWWHAWVAPAGPDYFPLKTDLQWLEWRAFGWHGLPGYHAVSVALHAVSGCLLLAVLRRLGLARPWLGALLWVAHPWNVESVAWLAELKNTCSLPFLLGAFDRFLAFARAGRRRDHVLAVLAFAAAMLAKSTTVMLPPVLLLYYWWRDGRLTWRQAKVTAPFWAIALALGGVTLYLQQHQVATDAAVKSLGWGSRVGQAGWAGLYYFWSAWVPVALMPVHPGSALASSAAWAWVPWLAYGILAGLAARAASVRARGIWFGLAAFWLCLLPVSGLVPMSFSRQSWVAEHFVYISLLAWAGLALGALNWLLGRDRLAPRVLGAGLAVAGVAGEVGLSRTYAATFTDPETYWRHALAGNPAAAAAHDNLGLILLGRGERDAAAAHFAAALASRPRDVLAETSLGEIAADRGDLPGALGHFRAAAEVDPAAADVYYNQGNVLAKARQLPAAIASYRRAAELAPTMPDVHYNLGNALAQEGDTAGAAGEFQRALELAPDFGPAHFNLGSLLAERSDLAGALPHFVAAARLLENSAEAHSAAADALAASGQAAAALPYYRRALELTPGDNDLRQSYIRALRSLGRTREALEELERH